MKCIIIYFSQTGNTEKIAKAIHTGVKQAAGHCDIVKMKDANPRRLSQYDLIGLGSPVFGIEPDNVRDFINNMRFVGGKHIFVFCTHGGVPDEYFPSIVPKLKQKGLVVIGMRDWYGNCSLLHHIEPYPTAGHPDDIALKEAESFGKEMVEVSRRVSAGEKNLIPPVPVLPPRQVPDLLLKSIDIINSFPSLFKYHKEKCKYPRCRLCMDNCPMDGIDLTVDPPVLADPCTKCEFCARICPTGALDMDAWVEAISKATVPITEFMIIPKIDKAEAEGRFRRYLPKEKIDFKTYSYMLHKKHPQWIIGKGQT